MRLFPLSVVAVSLSTLATISPFGRTPIAPSSLAGSWSAQVPDVVRNEDGVQSVESTTTALLRLETLGDSVTGTITRGTSKVARPLNGTSRGSAVTLQGRSRARVNVNGQDYELTVVATYRLTLSGDTLRGTVETALDSTSAATGVMLPGVEQAPLPVVAVRIANPPAQSAPSRLQPPYMSEPSGLSRSHPGS